METSHIGKIHNLLRINFYLKAVKSNFERVLSYFTLFWKPALKILKYLFRRLSFKNTHENFETEESRIRRIILPLKYYRTTIIKRARLVQK